MWYEKKKARNLATRPKTDALNEQTRLAIRARLAIMQFRRHRMNKDIISAEEEGRRKDLGIWSFGGGKKMGPLKPRTRVENEIENNKSKNAKDDGDDGGNNKEGVDSNNEVVGKDGKLQNKGKNEKKVNISGDVKNKQGNDKNIRKGRQVLEKADHKVSGDNNDSPRKNNVPQIPLSGATAEVDDGIHSKSTSDRSDRSVDFTSRDLLESPGAATGSEPSSHGRDSKRPGSSRKLFTVVTPAFHQSETRGSPSFKRRSMPSDATSVKSMQNGKSDSPDSDLPPRPTTSFKEKGQTSGKLVGAALHSSPVRSNKETSGKLAAGSPVKVKPKTIDLGETKGDSARIANVAKAGAKSPNH